MAAAIPIITAVAGLAGAASSIHGFIQSKKKSESSQRQAPTVPTEKKAQDSALEDQKKRRRQMSITDHTRGGALVPDFNVQRKSLLGA